MRVLMIDKNFFFDRRIGLMCLSLEEMGHETQVVLTSPPEGYDDRSERQRVLKKQLPPDANIEKIYFPTEDKGFILYPLGMDRVPPHVLEARYPLFRDPRLDMRYTRELEDEHKHSGVDFKNLVSFALNHPQAAYKWINKSDRFGPLPTLLASLVLFPSVLFRGVINALFGPPKDEFDQLRKHEKELDFWDLQVIEYATKSWVPDVICANDSTTLRAATVIKHMLGIPLVFDAHELYSYQPGMKHGKAKKAYKTEAKFLKNVDRLITVNRTHTAVVKRDIGIQAAASCTNATILPEGFNPKKSYRWIHDKLPIPPDHYVMLFQGGINRARRVDYLLEGLANADLNDVHMVFLTFGQEIKEFQALAQSLGIGHRVHFLPTVPWDEVVYWAASADVGIMPYQATDQNTTLASPNKMYEFIMAATPMIVSSDLIHAKEVIEGEGFGVAVPLRDTPDYTYAIETMFDHKRGGPKRFKEALLEKSEKYDWKHESADAMRMYAGLADKLAKENTGIDAKKGKSKMSLKSAVKEMKNG